MRTATSLYKGHRYPVEIINHCVWLYWHLLSAADYRQVMADRFAVWGEVTALDAAA